MNGWMCGIQEGSVKTTLSLHPVSSTRGTVTMTTTGICYISPIKHVLYHKHDYVIKWKCFWHYQPFVRGIMSGFLPQWASNAGLWFLLLLYWTNSQDVSDLYTIMSMWCHYNITSWIATSMGHHTGCWCPGACRHQGISSHHNDLM